MANDILVKIGADISDFSRKMNESSRALEDFSKANQQTFDAFRQTGAAVTGAGVALSAGLGFAVKTAADFERSEERRVGKEWWYRGTRGEGTEKHTMTAT